jgi:hypothetical protein
VWLGSTDGEDVVGGAASELDVGGDVHALSTTNETQQSADARRMRMGRRDVIPVRLTHMLPDDG